MKHLVLVRYKDTGKETVGVLRLYDGNHEVTKFSTVELPWRENRRNISCIPTGTYNVLPRHTIDRGHHFILEGIRNRSGVLIHAGNFYTEIRGCILVGLNHADINKDGELDVVESKKAMLHLIRLVTEPIKLTIVETVDAGKV